MFELYLVAYYLFIFFLTHIWASISLVRLAMGPYLPVIYLNKTIGLSAKLSSQLHSKLQLKLQLT